MKKLLSTIWRAGYPILISVGVDLLCTFAAVMFFAGMYYQQTGLMAIDISAGIIDKNILLLTGVVSLLVIPLYMLFISRDSKKYEENTTICRNSLTSVFMCIAGACGAALALTFYLRLLNVLYTDNTMEQYAAVFDDTTPLVMIIVTIILTPVCEELLYRGLVFKRISRAYGFLAGALVSSIVYALFQGNISQGVYGFLLGMLLCLAYEKTEKIWIPIVMHMSAATFVLILDDITENLSLFSEEMQFTAGIAGIVVGLTVAILAIVYLRKYSPQKESKVTQNISVT